jgi:hypothetical protein
MLSGSLWGQSSNQENWELETCSETAWAFQPDTTADVYTHTSADANRGAALALEQAISGDLFQVVPRFGTRNNETIPNE